MQVRSHFLMDGEGGIFWHLAVLAQLLRGEDPELYAKLEQVACRAIPYTFPILALYFPYKIWL